MVNTDPANRVSVEVGYSQTSRANHRRDRLRGIEGLRGLCIASVLIYHYWVQSLPGGFIGVSVFFTISGFVITSSLIDRERTRASRDVASFWLRRLRRLWPAAVLTLVVVLVLAHAGGWSSREMADDSLAAFAQTYNWHVISTGAVYGQDLPSIVGHFWSLSIEMQFYVVAPLISLCLIAREKLHAAVYLTIVCIALVVSLNSESLTFVYSSTITRAGEISMGCLIAIGQPAFSRLAAKRSVNNLMSGVGLIAIVSLVGIAKYSSMTTKLYANGGLLLIAVLSSVSIIGLSNGRLVARAFAITPLRFLGAISYSLYLIHFPVLIFVIWWKISPGTHQWVALAISVAISIAMYTYVETPFRNRRFSGKTNLVLVVALVVSFVVVQTVVRANPRIDSGDLSTLQDEPSSITGSAESTASEPRIAIFGDSTAVAMSHGLANAATGFEFVGGYAELGCPIGEGGLRRGLAAYGDRESDTAWPVEDNCSRHNWIETTRDLAPVDVAIVLIGNWDIVGRRIDSLGDSFLTIDDPQYRDWLIGQIEASADGLHEAGAGRVLWLTLPVDTHVEHNTRLATFNELVREVATTRPWITIADYASYVEAHPELRPDGIHLSPDTSLTLVNGWLDGQIQSVVSG